MYGWRDGCGGTDWGAVAVSSVFWILVVAAIVVGVVLVTRSLSQRPGAPTAAGSAARAILQERFARGEIDEEEYQRRLRTLG